MPAEQHAASASATKAVVERALDVSNPRPLRRSTEDDDTLISAVDDPASMLPVTTAGRQRLWEAVNVDPISNLTSWTRRARPPPARATQERHDQHARKPESLN